MASYLSSVVLAAGIMALASLFAPDGKQKKWVSFLFGLVSFTVIVSPITTLSSDLLSFEMPSINATSADNSAEEFMWDTAQTTLEMNIAKAFGISPSAISVAFFDTGTSRQRVHITIQDNTQADEIKAWTKAYLGEGWEVYIYGR